MSPSRAPLPAAALVVAFAFPLLVSRHTLPLATFYGEWAAALLGVALILVLAFSAKSKIRFVPWIAALPLWLIATTLLQAASGMDDVTGTRLMTQVMLGLAATVMAAAWWTGQGKSIAERGEIVDALALAFLVAGLLGALTQWVQVFHLEREMFGLVSEYFHSANRRLWGNLNQPNHQATVQGLALVAAVWMATRGALRFPAWLIAVLLLETGIVLSGSRTGVVHVGIASVYALIAAAMARHASRDSGRTSGGTSGGTSGEPSGEPGGKNRPANVMQRPTALVVMAIVMAALLLILQPLIRAAGQTFGWQLFDTIALIQAGGQLSGRHALWAHALAMFHAHPWLGIGYGEFGWAEFQLLAQVGARPEMALHAHNAVLDMLAKTGLVGTAGVLLILLAWLWRVVRGRLLRGHGAEHRADLSVDLSVELSADRAQTVMLLAWLAMFGLHSMLEYPLHYLYFLLPFSFLLGWLETGGAGSARWVKPLGIVVGVAGLVVLVTTWQDYRRVQAREYAPEGTRDTLPRPAYWFDAYARAQTAEDATITPDNARALLPSHIASVHLLPMPATIARTAWLFALTGEQDRARLWMDRLRYYYQGDERAQFAALARSCEELQEAGTVQAAAQPREFCAWVRAKSRRWPEE
ncbi:PglL family O-oligosaccharyltransferase [Cupriavidus plantarum]|uniref:PglL family O-oligosaccharyltransferase n=2 Tax=Cupriavidus plantarum TaxID=942865 RepID=UPI00339D5274